VCGVEGADILRLGLHRILSGHVNRTLVFFHLFISRRNVGPCVCVSSARCCSFWTKTTAPQPIWSVSLTLRPALLHLFVCVFKTCIFLAPCFAFSPCLSVPFFVSFFLSYFLRGSRCSLHPEDGGSKVLRNVGILPHHYTVSRLRRPRNQSLYLLVSRFNSLVLCFFLYFSLFSFILFR
jgi:hypothetical protein